MPTKINLDGVVTRDLTVTIGGRDYQVPASPPMPYFVFMQDFLGRFTDDSDSITNGDLAECYEQTLGLLRSRDADANPDITAEQCLIFFANVYGGANQPGEDEEADPTPTRGGTTSRPRKTRSRSRS